MLVKLCIVLILHLFIITNTIGIKLQQMQQKCMIVYTVGQSQSVKLNIKFPQIPDRIGQQHYQIYIKNTQSNQIIQQKSLSGLYKRQLSLSPNVIYQICFKLVSYREIGRLMIQYTAENLFNLEQSQIKVPQNLLKSGDFKGAYQDAEKLKNIAIKFQQLQTTRKQHQSQNFNQTVNVNKNLVYISVAQIIIIFAAGFYQFFTLKKYLASKQYI